MLTDRQLAERQSGIGSSDAAAILGFSPWRTPADVRLEKLGLVDPEPAGELAEIGTALEPAIANLAARRLGVILVEAPDTYIHPGIPIMRANVDRQVEKAERGAPICEIKDSGLDDAWGEPGGDELPPYVLIQVCFQLAVVGSDLVHVARLGRGWKRGLTMYRVTRTDSVKRLIGAIELRVPQWWHVHIINRDPLPATDPPPSLDLLKRIGREPSSHVEVPAELVEDAKAKRAAKSAAEKASKEADARLIDALGVAEGGTYPGGEVTYLSVERDGYSVAATRFRQLKFKVQK